MRVVFWGTPEFATPSLRALCGEAFDVVAVVTQPDRAVGRSRSAVQPPPVKVAALEEGLDVLQPDRPRDENFIATLRSLEPDISVVVAYGHILPAAVIDLPRLGTINAHASLLPALRGAAPIQGALLAGLEETGISIMRMVPRLDAGPVILRVKTPIAEDETAGELTLRLAEMGALATIEALPMIATGRAVDEPQNERDATYAPKIATEAARIDWTADPTSVLRLVRAYDPRPGAWTTHRGTHLKLFGATTTDGGADAAPGTVMSIEVNGMVVAARGSAVRVTAIQPAGKRVLTPAELARGRGLAIGDRLS